MGREERVDSGQYTWVLDRLRHRFRLIPRGRDPEDPRYLSAWRPYFALWPDPDGGFTLALDEAGTRLHRVVLH